MKRRSCSLTAFMLFSLAAVSPALALTQPDNTPIPVGPNLASLFKSRGENVDALKDAAILPETFIPACALTFNVLQRNAGYRNSFGWYNVKSGAPTLTDLHEFLSCNDNVGTTKVLDIKKDPAYQGGEIGFYQATGACGSIPKHDAIFFSQRKYNPDGNQQNPFIHLLIYNSTVTAKAFYFCWEDLLSGGDNDFDDLTTFVTGISCSGGGAACPTGKPGICADGTLQCQSGMLSCVQSNSAGAEVCDGLDNDCNGKTDDGEICPAGKICDKGTCVPRCGSGEFVCPADEVCSGGYCVDPKCAQVTCNEGQRCQNGACVSPCNPSITCPHGQVCRVGSCVDPCTTLTCDADQVCVGGACVEKCQCAGCGASETCQSDGLCLASACKGKSCAMGEFCAADGTCTDACAGAACPSGQVCKLGQCVAAPSGAGAGGSGVGGGFSPNGGADVSSSSGSSVTGAGGANGMGGAGGSLDGTGLQGSCGCRVERGDEASLSWGALGLGLVGVAAGLRRQRRGR
jgi:MYXO-CTERM domain-containing protein